MDASTLFTATSQTSRATSWCFFEMLQNHLSQAIPDIRKGGIAKEIPAFMRVIFQVIQGSFGRFGCHRHGELPVTVPDQHQAVIGTHVEGGQRLFGEDGS